MRINQPTVNGVSVEAQHFTTCFVSQLKNSTYLTKYTYALRLNAKKPLSAYEKRAKQNYLQMTPSCIAASAVSGISGTELTESQKKPVQHSKHPAVPSLMFLVHQAVHSICEDEREECPGKVLEGQFVVNSRTGLHVTLFVLEFNAREKAQH